MCFITSVYSPCWAGSRRVDQSGVATDHKKNSLHRLSPSTHVVHAPHHRSVGIHISNLASLSHLPHTLHPSTFPAIEKCSMDLACMCTHVRTPAMRIDLYPKYMSSRYQESCMYVINNPEARLAERQAFYCIMRCH